MDGLGHQLLAGAGLARDEDGQLGRRGLAEALEDRTHAGARADEGAELRRFGDADLLGVRGVKLEDRVAARDEAVLGEVDLADAGVADEGSVSGAQIADADAALGRDQLHVNGADFAIVEHEIAGFVAAHHLRFRPNFELGLVAVALGNAKCAATNLEAALGDDGGIHRGFF